jgi:hypothetical protein
LYEGETWSHTFRKKHIPRLFKNMMLSKIFGPKTASGMYGKRLKCIQGSEWKNLKGDRGYSEDLGIDGMIILKWILVWGEGVDWIHLLQNRHKQ